jgi:acyl dehydratase
MPDQPPEHFALGRVTRTGIVRYAGASGDFNPVHHDEPYAVSLGLPGIFAMGLYPGGVAAAALEERVGVGALRELSLRFIDRVWPGQELVLDATAPPAGHDAAVWEFVVRAAQEPALRGSLRTDRA